VPNLVIVPVVNGTVKIFNNSPDTVHVVADLAGFFTRRWGRPYVDTAVAARSNAGRPHFAEAVWRTRSGPVPVGGTGPDLLCRGGGI
jgi:hypothetical protein